VSDASYDKSSLLDALRREGLDSVAGAFAFRGGQELAKPGLGHRSRVRFEITDGTGRVHRLYMKRYDRPPLRRRVAQLLACGLAPSPAHVEYANIRAARQAGIPTMREVVCGAEAGRSFLIVTAVPGDALERCLGDFLHRGGDARAGELTCRLAELVRRFHRAGFVHRDLYASHVFLDESSGGVQLYLIDLARMFRPRWRVFRWRVKDLAQLKYSMPPQWVERYWQRFMDAYLGEDPSARRLRYEAAIEAKVASMRRRAGRHT